jgi:hypothetical protein
MAIDQWEGDVLEHRHVRPDRVRLEHHAEVAPIRRNVDPVAAREHRSVIDGDFAGVGGFQAGDALQRRGLAAAAGAKQGEELTSRDDERHTADGDEPVSLGDE